MCTTCTSTLNPLSFAPRFQYFHLMNYEQLLQYINVMIKVFSARSLLAREKWKISEKREKWQMCGYVAWRLCEGKSLDEKLFSFRNAFVNDLNFVLLSHLLRKCHRDFPKTRFWINFCVQRWWKHIKVEWRWKSGISVHLIRVGVFRN